ncbi:MAG: ankyrin repeat domain-containing protein [Acidobacteriaceae bacterium]
MKQKLSTRRMREHPDLEQLKRQAKELLAAFKAADAAAVNEVNACYDDPQPATFALHDAQLVIARSYGFDSWPKLKAYVDGVTIRRLVEAVRIGDIESVRTMLKARPELANMAVSYGDEHRAIHYAVVHREPEIARLLMRKGANARAGIYPHRDATSAWTLARERGYDEIVGIIQEEENRRAKPAHESTVAPTLKLDDVDRAAVANGDLQWLRSRFVEGKLANHVRWNGGGLLTVAARNNRVEVLRFLLDECKFDPDERVASGEGDWVAYSQGIPLWNAAAMGLREVANLLLDRGANPNVHVDSSGSPVYSAYSHKQWEMVELLRARGGIVTPDTAALYRDTQLARQILDEEDRGTFAGSAALTEGSVVEDLLRFGGDGGAAEIVRMALERVDWSRHDVRWFHMLAAPLSFWHHIPWLEAGDKDLDRSGYLECFRLVLNACDANVVGSFGRGILHEIAAMRDWITEDEVIAFGRAALVAGARTDYRDEILKSTPLGWACRWGRIKLVRLLLEHGAVAEEKDAETWAQPLAWARTMGHNEIVSVLTRQSGTTSN